MNEPIPPPPQPPYTNVPFTEVPSSGPTAYQPPPQAGYPPPPGAYPPLVASPGLSENSAAALAYVTIVPAIVFLVLEPYNRMPFVRFHAIQCLGLAAASFAIQIGLGITSTALHFIPLIGVLFGIIHFVVFLLVFVAWLICIIKASQGQWYKLPVIGDFAEKQARG